MCFGGGGTPSDNGAAAAAQQAEADEAARQARIREGQSRIDSAFGQFDDDYYGGYENAYKDNYLTQVDDQYDDARAKLIAALARKGTLESTSGINAQGQLDEELGKRRVQIGDEASSAAQGLKSRVEQSKSDLYGLNTASADPDASAARATAEAQSLVAKPTYSPLGQIFADIINPFTSFVSADRNSLDPQFGFRTRVYTPLNSRGSATVRS